ncbi:MAG: RnfABCDGE type electron transport complex subunit D [Desulfobacterales bacterium]|nr:RnfABCDGE type electron transport complex subunit D [Desulfobacterales bacterium]
MTTDRKKFIVSHAPYWHNGSSISERSYNIMFAAIPAILMGLIQYGGPAMSVLSLSISTAMLWELLMNKIMKHPFSIGDGNSAVIGLLFGMMVPASLPWWVVITGTFVAVVIGKVIFGGIGANAFHPVLVSISVLTISWGNHFDFDSALVHYNFDFVTIYPLVALKYFGVSAISDYSVADLLMGKQIGGIGSTFGIGLIIGGIYLIIRRIIRWEISVSFLAGIILTAAIFNISNPEQYANPIFHLLTGYTLIGAFFLATEDSSSPVNTVAMIIYGLGGGILTVVIRNIGTYVDGVVFAILLMNLINPLLDKIRPKAIGKVA